MAMLAAAAYYYNTKPAIIKERISRKIFVGGLPLDAKNTDFERQFGMFGPFTVDWDSRSEENFYNHGKVNHLFQQPRKHNNGFAFLIFQTEELALRFVNEVCVTYGHGGVIYTLLNTRSTRKFIQVRPWSLVNAHYTVHPSLKAQFVNCRNTVFIGAVPRQVTASQLAFFIGRQYGEVEMAQIDWDTALGYPKGAARITFKTFASFIKAMSGRYVDIPNINGFKRMEIKPYIMDNMQCDNCSGLMCDKRPAVYFCSAIACLQYYCEHCWNRIHYWPDNISRRFEHKPHQKLFCMSK